MIVPPSLRVRAAAAVAVARAYGCVAAMGALMGECPAPVATAVLKAECEPAPLLAALGGYLTLITDCSVEVRECRSVCVLFTV